MDIRYMRFGQAVRKFRKDDERHPTLDEVSKKLGMSLSMLSDIEQGRRRPFDSRKIEEFCQYLNLSAEDKARLYDLAAREKSEVPSDIEDTMMYTEVGDMARMALRMTNDGIADEEDWRSFIRRLEEKRGRKADDQI